MSRSSRRMQRASAFTLIELLVVIAIIAILAAILFPVFAQARQAARGASSTSNLKQISLGVLMYVQDYDETYPIHNRWGDPASPFLVGGTLCSIWSYDIAPYLKNTQIFLDPLKGPENTIPFWYPLAGSYGYNYTVLSPYSGGFGTTPWKEVPAKLSSIARPADIVMLGGMMSNSELAGSPTSLYWYGSGTMISSMSLEAPDCDDIAPWCFSSWGLNGNWYPLLATEEQGKLTAGVSKRKSLQMNFAHCDGHVKFMTDGAGATGTTYYRGINESNVHITNTAIYKWEQTP